MKNLGSAVRNFPRARMRIKNGGVAGGNDADRVIDYGRWRICRRSNNSDNSIWRFFDKSQAVISRESLGNYVLWPRCFPGRELYFKTFVRHFAKPSLLHCQLTETFGIFERRIPHGLDDDLSRLKTHF